jgi:hypothetical protein
MIQPYCRELDCVEVAGRIERWPTALLGRRDSNNPGSQQVKQPPSLKAADGQASIISADSSRFLLKNLGRGHRWNEL